MTAVIKRLVAVAAFGLAIAACGNDSTGPGSGGNQPAVQNIGGNWTLAATISNATLQVSCQAAGQVQISQSGSNFTGSVSGSSETCTGPGGTATGNVDGPLTGGQVNGSIATYSDGTCDYTGTISGSPTTNLVKGSVTCNLSYQGSNYPFTGTWQVSR